MVSKTWRLKQLSVGLILMLVVSLTAGGEALAASQPDQRVLSWTDDPQTTQTVAWRSERAIREGKVQYLLQDEFTGDFSGALEKEAVCTPLYEGFNHFEVQIDDLQPGTTYAYRVGTDDYWSEAAVFTTAEETDQFSFMYMGDIQEGIPEWGGFLHQAYTDHPQLKFTLVGGDLVNYGESVDEWVDFFEASAGVFDRIPVMPTLGNHDDCTGTLYLKSFALPQNGPDDLKEHDYSFDYGNAHFVVLNSNRMGNEGLLYEQGINWLEADLASTNQEWKFVMFHHPPYPVQNDFHTDAIRDYWIPVLEQYDVDMVFVGHQHMYMRTYPMYEGEIQDKTTDGITYVMGNSGSKFYTNPDEHDYFARILPGVSNYQIIDIDDDFLTLTTKDENGQVLDEYKLNKGGDLDTQVSIGGVKLLDSSYQEITSVSAEDTFHLKASINNYTSKKQTVSVMVQVRGGSDATADCGGKPLGSVSLEAGIPPEGMDVYADFDLSDFGGDRVYVDVFVWDEDDVPVAMPYQQFSFGVTP